MRNKKSFYVLVAITIVVVVAAFLSQPSQETGPTYGLQLPKLGSEVEAVRSVTITKADDSVQLKRTDQGWVASSKDDYPADGDRIRHLVLGISDLQRLEKKTSNPDRYPELQLADVDKDSSKAVQITVLGKDDRKLADLLVGKTQDFEASAKSRYFVRNAGDPQSWLVEGTLPPVIGDISYWLPPKLLPGVKETGFQSVTVTQPDGEKVTVNRDSADSNSFGLVGLGADEKIDNQYAINAIPETFQRLSLKDVRKIDSLKDNTVALTVEGLTFNGVHIVAKFGHLDPQYSVRLHADYEAGHDLSGKKTAQGAGDETKDKAQDKAQEGVAKQGSEDKKAQDGADAGGEKAGGKKEQSIGGKELAENLNRRWRGRFFVVSQYSLDALKMRHSDLVKKPKTASSTSD
jgi:hypothetical protein